MTADDDGGATLDLDGMYDDLDDDVLDLDAYDPDDENDEGGILDLDAAADNGDDGDGDMEFF